MLRFGDIVFGPIRSRRLGSSLGINLLPTDGKLCNFDCIYCECGWNRDGRTAFPKLPTAAQVQDALEAKLKECAANSVHIDSITFSGNGEPTLHPEFPEIIDRTVAVRDSYCPGAPVSVLSNASRLSDEGVFRALRKIENPILKIDAADDEGIRFINRPAGDYSLEDTVKRMKEFGGRFILQTMFLRTEGFDSASAGPLGKWMDMVREVKPEKLMVYTVDRETPQKGLGKLTVAEMERLVAPLVAEGYDIQING